MADDPISACQECGSPVERVFHPVAVHFKGSGFYTTDYGPKSKATESSDGGDSKESGSSDTKSEKKAKAKASSGSSD